MAIGKPLNVDQRLGVQQPVLSPQTQALSSNVAAQKIQFADYGIGQANVKASYAVSDELINMVDAGVKAKMYIDNTKKDYQRLNLMEEWQKSDMDYKAQFVQALTLEAQEAVIADYDTSLQKLTGAWRKGMGSDLESEKYLSSLRSGSQKQFSAFSTTHSQTLFKQTTGLHTNTIARVTKALSEDKNADVVSGFKTIQDSTASLVGMGAIESEAAQLSFENLKDKIVTERSTLFAQDFAKNAMDAGHYPTDKEFKTQMEGVMGMELGERRLKLLQESFEDSYFKEIGERNRQDKAEETYALKVTKAGRLDLLDRVNKAIEDKTIASELKENLIKEAQTFDYAEKGFGAKIEKKIRDAEYGTSYKPFTEHFTTGEGRKFILEDIKADGTSYFDLKELRSHLETMGGKYEGMNESTIREVLTYWRGINDSTRKGLADQGEEVMQVALMSMIKEDQAQVPKWLQHKTMQQLGVDSSMLTQMQDPMHLNWSRTMGFSPAHAKAWNVTLSDIKAQFDSKQGVFSKESISQPADVQRTMLENYVGKLLEKNFSESVNEELARLDNEKLQEREKLETGKRRAMGSAFSQAYARGQAKQATSMEDLAGKNWSVMKGRVDSELKRADYEALNPLVKSVDKGIAALTPSWLEGPHKIKIGPIKSMKDVASVIMGNTPTDYILAEKNKQLQGEMEALLDRPLTQAELAGNDPIVNEMAQTIVDRETSSPLGRLWSWITSGESSETEIKLDQLVFELKQQSLKGMARGMQSAQPKQEERSSFDPTPQAPDSTVPPTVTDKGNWEPIPQEEIDRIVKPPQETSTAVEDLVTGFQENPIIQNLAGSINDFFGGSATTGGAVTSTSRDNGPDNWNSGQRYLDANGEFTDVMPLDVRDRILSKPEAFPDFTIYNLVDGDNLSRVAERAGISLEELQNLNSNTLGNENKLQIGDPILLSKPKQSFDDALMPEFDTANQSGTTPFDSGKTAVSVPRTTRFEKALMDKELGTADREVMQGKPYISSTLAGPGKIKDSQGNLLPEDKRKPQLNLSRAQRPVKNISDAPMTNSIYEASTVKSGLTIGFGHDVTQAELRAGAIHGIPFIEPKTGDFINLDNTELEAIFRKDLQDSNKLAKTHFNHKGFGISFEDTPEELQLFLTERAYSLGTKKGMPDADNALRTALAIKNNLDRMRRDKKTVPETFKKSPAYKSEMKKLKAAVDSFIFNVKERPAIQPRVDALFKMANTKDGLYRFFNLHGNYEGK